MCILYFFVYVTFQSRKDEEMRKRRNINEEDDDDGVARGMYVAITTETLQSLVAVGVTQLGGGGGVPLSLSLVVYDMNVKIKELRLL